MAATPLLSVSGLTKRYGSLGAIDDVSFGVRAGEVLGLIGPNGAGKTTLFECLAGVLPPTSGRILTSAGSALTARDRTSLIFYVPDGIRPYAAHEVRWVLQYVAGFFRGDAARVAEVVDAFHLAPFLNQRVGTLSKGQAKRALLAMGVLTPQPLLLVDEPFEGLDLRQTRDAARALRAHAGAGRTLFLSIHQIADAARFCDRLVLLSGGKVRGEGTASELIAKASAIDLEEAFLALT